MKVAYIIFCIVVPVLWGVFSAWLFDKVSAKRRAIQAQKSPENDPYIAADMYEI
jgi:hypothetical protein